jgi:hypothetical protein
MIAVHTAGAGPEAAFGCESVEPSPVRRTGAPGVPYPVSGSRCSLDLSCIGLVTTLGEVVEEGSGVVGDERWGGDLLVAEADRGGPQRS